MFSWSGVCVCVCVCVCVGSGTLVRMIIVIEVRKMSLIIFDPIRYEDPHCCMAPVCCIFPALRTSVMELVTVNLFLPSVQQKRDTFFFLSCLRQKTWSES